jgi:hypothetical protein
MRKVNHILLASQSWNRETGLLILRIANDRAIYHASKMRQTPGL